MIKIAAIGSEEAVAQMIHCGKDIENIQITPYYYSVPTESVRLVEQIRDCDVLLFAGPLPYYLAKKKIKNRWPALFVPSDEITLMATLLYITVHKQGIKKLSIDLQHASYADRVADEMGLDRSDWQVLDSSEAVKEDIETFDHNRIINFHRTNYENGKTELVLTSVDYVDVRLRELGIPSVPLIVPDKAVTDAIQRAKTQGELAISRHAELAVGMIVFHESGFADFTKLQEAEERLLRDKMSELTRQTESSIRLYGRRQFILYGTRGSIEQFLSTESLAEFLHQTGRIGFSVSLGIGYGATAKEAEENAESALFHAKQHENTGAVYVASSNKEIVGPLNDEKKVFALKSDDSRLLSVAQKTNSSIPTVTKLLQFSRVRHGKGFTAAELSEYLGMTRRSTERLIKKFYECGFANKVGEEQPYKKGRPRTVYRLTIE